MNFFRNQSRSLLTILIFGAIIITFIFSFGFQDSGTSVNALTSVNGEEISYREFARIRDQQIRQYGQLFGQGKMNKSLEQFIEQRIVNELVTRKVMAQKAEKMGIEIGKEDVLAELEKIQSFHDPELKRFSPRIYKLVLQQNGMRPKQFEESLAEELASKRLAKIIELSLAVSEPEKKHYDKVEHYRFTLHTARFDPKDLADRGKVDIREEDLKKLYEAQKTEFLTDEKRVLMIGKLDTVKLTNDIEVTEDEVSNYFEQNVKDSTDERWNEPRARAFHILISQKDEKGKSDINKIKTDLQREKSKNPKSFLDFFKQMAKAKSEDYSSGFKGGDLGYFNQTAMVKPFADAVFGTAKVGSLIGPVESDFGYHLIYLVDRATKENSLENRKKEIAHLIRSEKTDSELQEVEGRLQATDSVLNETTLTELGFVINKTDPITRSSKDAIAPFVVIQKAFELEPNTNWSGPEKFEDNLYVYKVAEVMPPESKSFEEARSQVLARHVSQLTEAMVKDARKRLAEGELEWSALKSLGAKVNKHSNVKAFQVEQVPGFGRSSTLLKAMQALNEADPVSQPLLQGKEWVLMMAEDIKVTPPNESASKEKTAQDAETDTDKDLLTMKRTDVVESFVQDLIEEAKIPAEFREKYKL